MKKNRSEFDNDGIHTIYRENKNDKIKSIKHKTKLKHVFLYFIKINLSIKNPLGYKSIIDFLINILNKHLT